MLKIEVKCKDGTWRHSSPDAVGTLESLRLVLQDCADEQGDTIEWSPYRTKGTIVHNGYDVRTEFRIVLAE